MSSRAGKSVRLWAPLDSRRFKALWAIDAATSSMKSSSRTPVISVLNTWSLSARPTEENRSRSLPSFPHASARPASSRKIPTSRSISCCISTRTPARVSFPRSRPMRPSKTRASSLRRVSLVAVPRGYAIRCFAYWAAARPHHSPNTRHSLKLFDPRRFAPLIETHAVSPTAYKPGSVVSQVEAEVRPVRTLERAARFDLLDHGSREDVPRPQLHLGREVALHVSLPVLVDQIAALAAGGLRDQDARPREARRMELDHLHVLQRHAGAVGEGHAVARLDEAVRREFVHAAAPAGREDRRLPVDRDEAPAPKVDGDHPRADPALDNQARHKILVEPVDVLELHRCLEERMQDVEADLVRRENGALDGHPAERTLAHPAVRVTGPGAAPVFELNDLLRAPSDEELDRVLVGEEVRSFDRVEGVQLEGIVVPQDRGGPTLRGHRVAPHRVDFRHDRDRQIRVRLRRRDRRAQPRRAPTDDHDVVRGPVHEPRNRVGRISFWHIRFATRCRAVSLRTRSVSPTRWQLSRRPAQKPQVARARWSRAMEVVRVEGLGKTYPGGTKALEGVSFSIDRGEIFCLLGRNGAGKTTLLRILATQLKPTVGRASVLGHDVLTDPRAIRPHIAVVPQEARPQMLLSPYDHIFYMCLIRGRSRADAKERTRQVIGDKGRTAVLGTVDEAKGDTGVGMRVIMEPAAGNGSAAPEVLAPKSSEEILAIVERGLREKRKVTFKPASLEDAFIKIVGGSIEVENT